MMPFSKNRSGSHATTQINLKRWLTGTAVVAGALLSLTSVSHAQLSPSLKSCLDETSRARALSICKMASTGAIGSDENRNLAAVRASEILRSESRYEEAIELLANRPSTDVLHLELGNIYFDMGDVQMADFHYEMAEMAGLPMTDELKRSMAHTAYMYAEELQFSDVELKGAINSYTRAIELDPDHMLSYLGRGQAHLARKEFEQACKDLDRAVTLGADWSGYLLRARCREGLGDTQAARSDYEAVLKLNPHHTGAKKALGM